MNEDLALLVEHLHNIMSNIRSVSYAYKPSTPLAMAYQIGFPRLEFVLDGDLETSIGIDKHIETITLTKNSALFIPANGWNRPEWNKKVKTLSVIFAKNIVGFSELEWNGSSISDVKKNNINLGNSRICDLTLGLLDELIIDRSYPMTGVSVLKNLIQYIIETSESSEKREKTSSFDSIRIYIENNYSEDLTREMVATHFHITPNHLSFIFKSQGHTKFIDYVNSIRLSHAKTLLQYHEFTVKEISEKCGFKDPNYFSRVFKKHNKYTPKEYHLLYGLT
jgi:AraC-like DNA-binding protein